MAAAPIRFEAHDSEVSRLEKLRRLAFDVAQIAERRSTNVLQAGVFTATENGLVPAPGLGNSRVLSSDGTWIAFDNDCDCAQMEADIAALQTGLSSALSQISNLGTDLESLSTSVDALAATVGSIATDLNTLEARTLTAGAGLTGGGDLSADRTFTVGAGTGITVNADDVQIDFGVAANWSGVHKFAPGVAEAIQIWGTGTGATNQAYIGFRDSAGTLTGYVGDGGNQTAMQWYSVAGRLELWTSANDYIDFITQDISRFRITGTGNAQILADSLELQIGASQDLRLYHDGTNSIIRNDTGILFLQLGDGTTTSVQVASSTGFTALNTNACGTFQSGAATGPYTEWRTQGTSCGYVGAARQMDGSSSTTELGIRSEGALHLFAGAGAKVGLFDTNNTAGNTRFMLYDVDNGQLERVSVGVADSGGVGFKLLRIPN